MVQFKWYVLNETRYGEEQFNHYPYSQKNKIRPWNIFNNWVLNESVNKLCEEFHNNKKMSFDEFKERLRRELQYYLWSKVEYEIVVGEMFEKDINNFSKIDCYTQVLPNLDMLAREVILQYTGAMCANAKEHEE